MKKPILSIVLTAMFFPVMLFTQAHAQSASPLIYGMRVDELELRHGDENEDILAWNLDAFVGGDDVRFRLSSQGEYDRKDAFFEGLESQFVVEISASTFFDVRAGIRADTPEGPDRWYGVVGLTGLAPQWIEINADLFVSENGDVSARLDAEYELLITNRLILTPSVDINAAFSDDTEIEIKAGLTSAEVGLRMSYDVVGRLISPYIGVVYESKLGHTADLAKNNGQDYEAWFGVAGVKMVF